MFRGFFERGWLLRLILIVLALIVLWAGIIYAGAAIKEWGTNFFSGYATEILENVMHKSLHCSEMV